MTRLYLLFIISILSAACTRNKIKSGSELSDDQLAFIQTLGVLDANEPVIKFYSEFKFKYAGNFYTDKRMASYWIDSRNSDKNNFNSAFYDDIISIDTVYYAGATFSPYMRVKTRNGKSFKLCADGEKHEIKNFFEGAINKWQHIKIQNDSNFGHTEISASLLKTSFFSERQELDSTGWLINTFEKFSSQFAEIELSKIKHDTTHYLDLTGTRKNDMGFDFFIHDHIVSFGESHIKHFVHLDDKNDTLYHYTTSIEDSTQLIFIKGKFTYLFKNHLLDSIQAKYYLNHEDSLRNVPGDNLPQLPSTLN